MDIREFFESGYHNEALDVMIPAQREEGYKETNGETVERLEKHLQENAYAITVTFRDVLLSTYKDTYLKAALQKVLAHTRGLKHYTLVSDYSAVGRLHFHGTIQVKDIHTVENLRKKCYKQFGITKLKLINNVVKWTHYCLEQYSDEGKNKVKVSLNRLLWIDSRHY